MVGPAKAAVAPFEQRRCRPPQGITGSPTSIAEAVALLEALPSPVTVPCFVESLDRPLHVFASASPFSAQSSMDVASPRIFIRNGALTMTVIAEGMGAQLLEFGEQSSDGRSIKAEVELGRGDVLSPYEPHERIRVDVGTTCGTCHDDEAPAPGTRAGYASEVLHPSPQFDVSLPALRRASDSCDPSEHAARCELLAALFGHGEVLAGTLPAGGRLCDH